MLLVSLALIFNLSWAQPSLCGLDNLSCPVTEVDGCCSPTAGVMVFAQQWLVDQGPADSFTIHGLWPNYCDGSFTPSQGCDPNRFYNDIDNIIKVDPELHDDMNLYWPSSKKNNPSFWSHEWNKHGTCLSTQEPRCVANYTRGAEVRQYFKHALAVRSQFDLYKALQSHNILPGRMYPKSEIQSALASMGGTSNLICRGNTINEIRTTFHVRGKDNLVIIDSMSNDSCPKSINFPRKSSRPHPRHLEVDPLVSGGLSLKPTYHIIQI